MTIDNQSIDNTTSEFLRTIIIQIEFEWFSDIHIKSYSVSAINLTTTSGIIRYNNGTTLSIDSVSDTTIGMGRWIKITGDNFTSANRSTIDNHRANGSDIWNSYVTSDFMSY